MEWHWLMGHSLWMDSDNWPRPKAKEERGLLTENIPAGKGKISPIAYSGISAIAYSGPSAAYIYVFPAMSRPFPFDGRSRGS